MDGKAVAGGEREQADSTGGWSCPECGSGELFHDDRTGDSVCRGCGVVVDERVPDFDHATTYNDPAAPGRRSGRGMASSARSHDRNLGTTFHVGTTVHPSRSLGGRGGLRARRLKAEQSGFRGMTNEERKRVVALDHLESVAASLELPPQVRELAAGLFRDIHGRKVARGRRLEDFVTASLYLACRLQHLPRKRAEFCRAGGVQGRDFDRCVAYFRRELALVLPPVRPVDYLPSIGAEMGLPPGVHGHARRLLESLVALPSFWGKDPASLCAAAAHVAWSSGAGLEPGEPSCPSGSVAYERAAAAARSSTGTLRRLARQVRNRVGAG
ncbi:MAG: TFIIB-type zinc ribbon-containing protein [Promethearchaeota archaeon]